MLILLAAITGMRLGELRALRWSDIDYRAMKIRVRREYVRGQYDKPKSLGSERGIPLAARLVTELDEHHQRTAWHQDNDLVLAGQDWGRLSRATQKLMQHCRAGPSGCAHDVGGNGGEGASISPKRSF
jgi:integrase